MYFKGNKSSVNYGSLEITYNNVIFYKIIKFLLDKIEAMALRDKSFSAFYLRGVLAAEGSCKLNKRLSSLNGVRITAVKQKERQFYEKILRKLNIHFTTYGKDIEIVRFPDFIKLYNYDAFKICTQNRKKFVLGLYNIKQFKLLKRLLPFTKKKFTAKEFCNRNKITQSTAYNWCLKTFCKNGILARERIKQFSLRPLTASLSKIIPVKLPDKFVLRESGLNYLRIYQEMQREIENV